MELHIHKTQGRVNITRLEACVCVSIYSSHRFHGGFSNVTYRANIIKIDTSVMFSGSFVKIVLALSAVDVNYSEHCSLRV